MAEKKAQWLLSQRKAPAHLQLDAMSKLAADKTPFVVAPASRFGYRKRYSSSDC
jgi:hypothetical protein